MASMADSPAQGLSFWQKMALGLGLFVVFAFGQFAARGFVDIPRVPLWVHLHAGLMLGWLTLGFVQPGLARSGNRALHRRLGWLGLGLALAIAILGSFTSVMAVGLQRQPPFFTPPYFLALNHIEMIFFAGMVMAAISWRRDTRWHQRLMLGSSILILEPALGRVLPMPLLMPWGEWAVMLGQLAVLWLVVRHDRASLGAVHPATRAVGAAIVLMHVLIEVAARTDLFANFAARIVTG